MRPVWCTLAAMKNESASMIEQSKDMLATASFIKEIGRGKDGARSLSRNDACTLYAAMLDGRVSDIELGAVLLAMRIKGESADEIAGFLDAAEASLTLLAAPSGNFAPVIIPSYNGARRLANLTPLLATLLAREGVPVLVHGVTQDNQRVTSAEIFTALGVPQASNVQDAQAALENNKLAFMPVQILAPKMAHLLAMRRVLGVRNSTHTLVKILQPFACAALRLTSYTHPEYLDMLSRYFSEAAPAERGDAFLMRGTEGETVASARRAQQIDWFHDGQRVLLTPKQSVADTRVEIPEERDADITARWIEEVLAGKKAVPDAVAGQVRHCLTVAASLRATG